MNGSKFYKNIQKFVLITFDVNDTLFSMSIPPHIQYSRTAREFGYDVDENVMKLNFRNTFKDLAQRYPNFGRHSNIEHEDWWRQIVYNAFDKSNIPENDLKKIANKLIEIYLTDKSWTKAKGSNELINKIKSCNKSVGLISNTDPSLHKLVKVMKLPTLNFILTSHEAGFMKPSIEIYKKALEISGLEKREGEALHIGNSYENDYLGARNAGWSSVLLGNMNDFKNQQINANHVFSNIEDLLKNFESREIEW